MYKQKTLVVLSKILGKEYKDIVQMPETTMLSSLGMTSIQFVELIVEIEREFNIEINDSDLLFENFTDIRTIFKLVNKYIHNQYVVKKVLVLDCDNVLWTGVAGEEPLVLSYNNIVFQNEVIQLYKAGVIICLCSKNQQSNIYEAFKSLNMPLSFTHISSYKINYLNKSDNIIEISNELNLSLDSFVGYRIGKVNSTQLVRSTFQMAYKERCPVEPLTFHTDRGSNYHSKTFCTLLCSLGITQSFSRAHIPYDNSVMESFFSNLKREELYRTKYRSEKEFRTAVNRYMVFYNEQRPHAKNGYKTPFKKEQDYLNKQSILELKSY